MPLWGQENSGDLATLPETLGSRFQAPDYGLEAGERDLSGRLARLEGMVREITSRLFPALPQTLAESPTVLAEFILPTADYNSSLLPRLPHPLPQNIPPITTPPVVPIVEVLIQNAI